MHLILTGATGLVGSAVLEAMIKAADVTQITVLSRRPVPLVDNSHNPKVRVIMHRDFAAYDADLLAQLRGASGCVWALGVSQTKVARDEYVKITKDYALAAAAALTGLGAPPDRPFRFVYVSGEGATQTPSRFSAIFARVKGETEQALADIAASSKGALRADSVRPGFVDAAQHDTIKQYIPDPGFLYRATTTVLGPVVRAGMPGTHSPTPMLGSFLVEMAMGARDASLEASGAIRLGPSWIVPNVAIRKSMGFKT